MRERIFHIGGMHCENCAGAVKEALESIDGVTDVRVDLDRGRAVFTEEKPVDRRIYTEAVEKIGYAAEKLED